MEMTTAPVAMSTTHVHGGFEKTDDIVHYRSGPRVSSGYLSQDSSNRTSPDKIRRSNRTSPDRLRNSNGRRANGSNGHVSSIAHSIAASDVVITKSGSSSSTSIFGGTKELTNSYDEVETDLDGTKGFVETEPIEGSNNSSFEDKDEEDNMPPNNSSTTVHSHEDGIISGHKIALNVHYDQDKLKNGHVVSDKLSNGHTTSFNADAYDQKVSYGTPPASSGNETNIAPVMIDEQPALRELDAVIAHAQRTSVSVQNTPEHFVDAAEHFDLEKQDGAEAVLVVQDQKITHVDRLTIHDTRLSSATSQASIGDVSQFSPLKAESPSPDGSEPSSPHSGSTASVDGPALSSVEESSPTSMKVEEISMERRDEYTNGPDQVIPASAFKTWEPNGAVQLHVSQDSLANNTPISVPTLLKKTAQKYPNQNAMMEKVGKEWVPTTYSQYYQQVRTVAKAFIKLGLQPYHGVCILGFNSKEWFISDLAAIFAGGFAAGIYTTNSAEACQHCALNCQAQVWVVEDQKQLDKVLKIRGNVPSVKTIIQYKGKPTVDGVLSWDEVVEIGQKEDDTELEERLKRIAVNQCCTLIYTSGTTGPPKGVMLSHDNITWTALSASIYFKMVPTKEVVVSYLPLSHVAAQLADIYMALINAGTAYFASPDALKGSLVVTLNEVRPTAFLGVPRVWEKIYEKMMDVGRKTKGIKKSIATWAKALGLEANERKQNSDFSKPFGFAVADAVVFKKIKQVLGLDRCNVFLSGAAPISPDIVKYFHSLNITLVEIYGMSETSGPHTTGIETAFKLGSAGRTIPGTSIKIDKPDADGNGEVCMVGRNISMGYLQKEETTNDTIDDQGWVHSGDIGKLDDGYLFITGRLKELIITAGGENIPPVLIEDTLKTELSCISNAMLIGDKRKFLSILLTLKTNMNLDTGEALDTLSPACIEWCESIGSSAKNVYDVLAGPDPHIMRAIQDGIDRANKNAASNAQRVQKWTILPRDFTVPGDELGPTMKLKRPVVNKKYSETIERFYA